MKEQSTTKSFAILSIAGIIAKLLSLVYIPVLTRILNFQMDIYYGLYDIFVFIYALTNIGMQTAISKYVSELSAVGNHKDAIRTFKIARGFLIGIGLLCMFTMFFGANFIANFMKKPEMAYGIMFLSPAILTTSILATYKGYFQGRNNMTPVALASIFEQIANVFISIFFGFVLVKLGGIELGSAGATIGTSIGAIIAVLYLIYMYKILNPEKEARLTQEKSVKRVRTKVIIKVLIAYGLPITLSSGLQNFGNIIDLANVQSRLLAAGFMNSEAREMYALLGQWRTLINIPMIFITSLCIALLPVLSKANVLKDKIAMNKNIKFAFRLTYVLAIPSTIGLMILSKEVYQYLFGRPNGYEMMIVGGITIILMAIVFVQNIVLQSINKFYFVMYTLVFGLVIKFISNYILIAIPSINIYGAVIGFIVYFTVVSVINHYKITKVTKIKIRHLVLIIKPFLASLYMGFGIVVLRMLFTMFIKIEDLNTVTGLLYTAMLVVFGVVLYIQGLITFKAVRKSDIRSVSPRLYNKIPQFIKNRLQ